jgi:hypothetical protein
VTVLAEQRFDHREDRRVRDRRLARRTPIQHLVPELFAVATPALRRERLERRVDLGAHARDLVGCEHVAQHGPAVAFELDALGRRVAVVHREILQQAADHRRQGRRHRGGRAKSIATLSDHGRRPSEGRVACPP